MQTIFLHIVYDILEKKINMYINFNNTRLDGGAVG